MSDAPADSNPDQAPQKGPERRRTFADEEAERQRISGELRRRDEGVVWRWIRGFRVEDGETGAGAGGDAPPKFFGGLQEDDVALLNECASRAVWRTIFGGFVGVAAGAAALRTRRVSAWVHGVSFAGGQQCAVPRPARPVSVIPLPELPVWAKRATVLAGASSVGAGVGVVTAANACISDVVARPGPLGRETRELLRVFLRVRQFEQTDEPVDPPSSEVRLQEGGETAPAPGQGRKPDGGQQ
jgi:hypothetical protein